MREGAKAASVNKFRDVLKALLISNGLSVFLLLARAIDTNTYRYWYMLWNLVLAWLPLVFAWWLSQHLKTDRWVSGKNILLTLLWLGFLPNSFYILTDLIHLHFTGEVSLLYDVVLLFSFIFNAYVVGYMSLFLVHQELNRRLKKEQAFSLIAVVLLLCSFAIYLGRYLRWNTWDVLINPAGLLFDVSDRFINPASHPQAFTTTATFFLLLSSIYFVLWQLTGFLRSQRR
jgi:uncharacterized membrane protein